MKIKMKTMALVGLMGSALLLTGCGGGGSTTSSKGDQASCSYTFSSGVVCNGQNIQLSDLSDVTQNADGSYSATYQGNRWTYRAGRYDGEVIADLITAQANGNDGTGVTTLVIDGFSHGVTHGDTVNTVVSLVAPGATHTTIDVAAVGGTIDLSQAFTPDSVSKVNSADTINMSFGSTIPSSWSISDFADNINTTVSSLNTAFETDAFITISAGNNGGSCTGSDVLTCNLDAMYLLSKGGIMTLNQVDYDFGDASEFRDETIVVGALESNGKSLKTYSTRAGILKNHYIAAPVLTNEQGTSFSAPLVSGVGALLKQNIEGRDFFDTGAKIKQRILTTADDLGVTGIDDIYGHGRLNVGRALAPVGGLR